jgi:phosphate transport system permease protein
MDANRLRRRAINHVMLGLAALSTFVALAFLVAILWTLVGNGVAGLRTTLFTQSTPPPGGAGGLANAIVGSLMMTGAATLIGAPVGILAGTWLAEYGRGRIASAVRFINDILLSAPSILIGLFVYEAVVVPFGHFSGWAGALALAIIMLPIVVRTTEDMLRLVPASLREAAAALGASRARVILQISYRAARAGIVTGVLLALARIAGETAPLLFTALNDQFWSTDMTEPMANLPVVIFQFAMSPYPDWQSLAWSGALLITVGILGMGIVARLLLARRESH